ncbi:MAG: pyridoxal phosphate-dependent aminotransferase [Proteobacteria bacterium]|nr:pyridoxal phosphate-dependent aminotransferase [Pseudomonadota bacterium]MBU1737142.1 pyridoxal phosphate-dependent aminotransferase [Pseudomonadota bacterium]
MALSKKMVAFAERSSWIRKMFEEGAKMKAQFGAENVFDFSLGNPDVPPPPEFLPAMQQIIREEAPGVHAYMPNTGYQTVRDAIAAQIAKEQDIALTGNDMLMTCGAAGGLNVVMKALLDPGDEVVILAPFFVEYNFYIDNHGGVTKIVNTTEDFSLDLPAIEQALTAKTKAIIINSPNNPTGQVYPADDLAVLGRILEEAGKKFATTIYLVADEPYRKIVFDHTEVPSIFKATTSTILVSSYSKDLSLPGERIGYIGVHPEIDDKPLLLGAMALANRILGFVNAPALIQRVVGKLQGVTVDNSIYEKRREMFCRILRDAGYEFVPPKGAFYLFPKSPLADDVKFVSLLQEEKILAVPGRGFGLPGYFRLAFCVEDSVIERSAPGFQRAIAAARAL